MKVVNDRHYRLSSRQTNPPLELFGVECHDDVVDGAFMCANATGYFIVDEIPIMQ
jgi:hypothetical protein